MRAEQAWATLSMLFALSVFGAAAILFSLGYDPYQMGALAVCAFVIYLYVVYKRYHIELVTEGDIALFKDPEDLQILCDIYGLEGTGRPLIDRQRLKNFVRAHPHGAFVWTAPRAVRSVGSALSLPEPELEEELTVPTLMKKLVSDRPSESSLTGSLVWDMNGHSKAQAALGACPVCESVLRRQAEICPECGADLAFYSSLTYSRLGRRLLLEKTVARKRKAR